MIGCRVKIVNHFTDQTTVVESKRDAASVFLDLVSLVRAANRQRDDTLRGSVHLTEDLIILHWHTGAVTEIGVKFNGELLAVGEPMRQVDRVLWGERGGAA